MLKSHLELNFDVLHAATKNRYADSFDIRLVNLGSIALFSKYRLTTSSVKQLKKIEHGHTACSMSKLLTSARGCDELSIGFDRSRKRSQRELTKNKNIEGKYHVRISSNIILGYSQHQLKRPYGLRYVLSLNRIIDSAVLIEDNAINNARN